MYKYLLRASSVPSALVPETDLKQSDWLVARDLRMGSETLQVQRPMSAYSCGNTLRYVSRSFAVMRASSHASSHDVRIVSSCL